MLTMPFKNNSGIKCQAMKKFTMLEYGVES
jgi:hypothetical protein